MSLWTRWATMIAGTTAALAMSACAMDAREDDEAADTQEVISTQLSATACTAVALTSPTAGFTATLGVALPLSAVATCPAGSTPEYQYWVKAAGAANWTILTAFVPGGASWTPPSTGSWAVTAVTRATGSTAGYEARAMSASGTVTLVNHSPTAGDDTITTTENVNGSVNLATNDSDPDGDVTAVIAHTSPAHGAIAITGTLATYTPSAGYIGGDSFTYTIGDGRGGTATATVTISVIDRPPFANDDAIGTVQDTAGTVNVLGNDGDPDPDTIAITAFTQGAHGTVTLSNGFATYLPSAGYVGSDSFTYTIDDGHGQAATATVNVTVEAAMCAVAISGPATATLGEVLHLTASATCNNGAPLVQWLHRINSSYEIVQGFGPSLTLDFAAPATGLNTYVAVVRSLSATPAQAMSNAVTIKIADSTPPCTAAHVTTPANGQTLPVGVATTLTASASCPGGTPEYQFWVKQPGAPNWTILPDFTTGNGSWTPPAPGAWAIRAVVRTLGSHVSYDLGSTSVAVTVTP